MILPDLLLDKFKNVLLIDDDDIVNSINKVMIDHAKFAEKVTAKTSVDAAMEYLSSVDSESFPDVIFLDLDMPVKNGWDFLEEFKNLEGRNRAKLVVLTSSISTKDETRAKEFDEIVAYVPKPLSPELIHQIHVKHIGSPFLFGK